MPEILARAERGRTLPGAALSLIHTRRAATRADLTAALGVSRATAGAVAADLQALGLIQVDTAPRGATGTLGRPSHRLMINPDGPVVLAAQVHPDGYQVALVGLGGVITAAASGPPTAASARRPSPMIRSACWRTSCRQRRGCCGRPASCCAGAGLAVPSAVAEPEGTAVSPLYLGWPTGAPIRDIFTTQAFRAGLTGPRGAALECHAANDINLAALAEYRHGAGRDAGHLLVVATGHRGTGGALVLDGRLYTGSSGLGMEAGHVTVSPGGRPCRCGNRGCLDVETDPVTFLEAAGHVPRPGVPVLEQAAAVLFGARDPAVRAVTRTFIEHLGIGLAGLINVLNPDRVLLGGLHRDLLAADPERLRAAVAKRSPWGRGSNVPLLPCVLDQGGLIGAAELAWQPVLDDPGILGALGP